MTQLDTSLDWINVVVNSTEDVQQHGKTPLWKALKMVEDGEAVVLSPSSVFKLHHRRLLKKTVLERDKYTCRYCGKSGKTIDHVVPRSEGGISSLKNCVCACYDCNQKKKSLSVEAFQAMQKVGGMQG